MREHWLCHDLHYKPFPHKVMIKHVADQHSHFKGHLRVSLDIWMQLKSTILGFSFSLDSELGDAFLHLGSVGFVSLGELAPSPAPASFFVSVGLFFGGWRCSP